MKTLTTIWLLVYVLVVGVARADSIKVHNTSGLNVHFATYYLKSGKAKRHSQVKSLSAGKMLTMERPPRKWFHDRQLVFHSKAGFLKESLSGKTLKTEKKRLPLASGSRWACPRV